MIEPLVPWFRSHGWEPFEFQREVWSHYLRGESGLVHSATGTGKSYAVWGGPILEWLHTKRGPEPGLRFLWITPLRALAGDTLEALKRPVEELGLPWRIEARTGDTSASTRARQRKILPTALVTTPESLSLFLCYVDAADRFRDLEYVVVDEWHELLGTKRGIQVELALARLRRLAPKLRVWGLSATLGNLHEARDVLLPQGNGVVVSGDIPKQVSFETILPTELNRFPWAGHIGTRLVGKVIPIIEQATSSLLFTNTRFQSEYWYRTLVEERPDWKDLVALHHGSLGDKARADTERRLREGSVKCVVCTSSLDLGVDFSPVDVVFQVGSPKGVARALQRAGRSGHQPGAKSRLIFVPTNAFEILEFAALQDAVSRREIEARAPLRSPLDVLVQHVVTVATGGGFNEEEFLQEVRTTFAYRGLTEEEWGWVKDFVGRGGPALRAYPQYARVQEEGGRYVVSSPQIARFHRLSIGTIVSESMVTVKYAKGQTLGSVEESFIAKLQKGETFFFAGKLLELVQFRDMKALVRRATKGSAVIPRWLGGRLPLSSYLAAAVRRKLDDAERGIFDSREMEKVRDLLELQKRMSRVPTTDELLVESVSDREGFHLFLFPFEGRLVHEGLGALLAYRLTRRTPLTLTVSVNDYGLQLLSPTSIPFNEEIARALLNTENLLEDILQSLNTLELGKRQFREIARVAGLVFSGYPRREKTMKQLQVSSGLLYDVFRKYDPSNLLLSQAQREVLENQLEFSRLRSALERLAKQRLVHLELRRFTPFSFPLWAEMVRGQVSSERWEQRILRMSLELEDVADGKAKPRKR